MFFIDLPRRYFSSRESIGQTLPGLELPRRYLFDRTRSRSGQTTLIPQTGVAQAHYCHTVMGGGFNLQVSKRRDLCAICPERTLEARIDHSEEM